ncbi:MAG TPA: adenine deaminase [Firmicutes bacterium]|nr:adenine deaminase [Bacillota bacterium]
MVVVSLKRLIAVARGQEKGDIIFRGGRLVNVFSGEVVSADLVICGNTIAAVGEGCWKAENVIDLRGAYLLPGLIDAHIHVESSMLTPVGFASAVLPHGTTAVVSDPHEIVNVGGLKGLEFMFRSGSRVPLDFFFLIPSCVPATYMETAGACLGEEETRRAFDMYPASPGLAEMMNFPGVLQADEVVLSKIAVALESGRLVDGHAPLLAGADLNAYIAAGISSDHECTSAEEALEKIRLGMKIIIREGSAARDLYSLLPAVNESNFTEFMFGCDDRHPAHLLREGEIDDILRKAVKGGLEPVTAVRMATINTARHYRLRGRGAIAPGYRADLVIVDNLQDFTVLEVYKDGEMVAKDGKLVREYPQYHADNLEGSVRLPDLRGKFSLKPPSPEAVANIITVEAGKIVTGWEKAPISSVGRENDILKVAVIERHSGKGGISVGLVKGFGLQRGALASTVAHDSHNLIVVGADDDDMEAAAAALSETGGGLVVIEGGEVRAALPLPVGGLMSYEDVSRVVEEHERIENAALRLGCDLPSPFMAMSFLALAVIPSLKITDRGLVDVDRFTHLSLWAQ